MLVALLLLYHKLNKYMKMVGFMFNYYYPCVANMMVNEKQYTVRFHVDNILSSHVNHTVKKI